MKFVTVLSAMTVLVSSTFAAPGRFWCPRGGWDSVDFDRFDWSQVDFDRVDWSQVPYNRVNWNRINWSGRGFAQWRSATPLFSSTYSVLATPDQVVNGTGTATTPTGGLPGARGVFVYGIMSSTNTICYNIAITGFQGTYQSLARTATHIHEAAVGAAGPPRITLPNPVLIDTTQPLSKRISVGCVRGPFTTGVLANGVDTGYGFQVRQIERNPSGFFTDIHSSLAVPGAVRGQIA